MITGSIEFESREDAIRFVQNIIDEFSINKEELDL